MDLLSAIKWANLALRFVLELCALAALGYWGAKTGTRLPVKVLLAIAAPVAAATAWGLFVAPRATIDVGSAVRLIVELLVFAAAVAGLLSVGRTSLAFLLAAVYLLNRALVVLWDQ